MNNRVVVEYARDEEEFVSWIVQAAVLPRNRSGLDSVGVSGELVEVHRNSAGIGYEFRARFNKRISGDNVVLARYIKPVPVGYDNDFTDEERRDYLQSSLQQIQRGVVKRLPALDMKVDDNGSFQVESTFATSRKVLEGVVS